MAECNLKLKQVNILSRLDNILSIFLESETFVEIPSDIQIALYDTDGEKLSDFTTIGLFQGLTEVIFFDLSDLYDGFKKICKFDVRLYRRICDSGDGSGPQYIGPSGPSGPDYDPDQGGNCPSCTSNNWDLSKCITIVFDAAETAAAVTEAHTISNVPEIPGGGCVINDGKLPGGSIGGLDGMTFFPYNDPSLNPEIKLSHEIIVELDINKIFNPPDYVYSCCKNGFDENNQQLYVCRTSEPGDEPGDCFGFWMNDQFCNGECEPPPPTTTTTTTPGPTTTTSAPTTAGPTTTLGPTSTTTAVPTTTLGPTSTTTADPNTTTLPPTSTTTTQGPSSSTTTTTTEPILEAEPQNAELNSYAYDKQKNKWIKINNSIQKSNDFTISNTGSFPLNGITIIKFKAFVLDGNNTLYEATEISGAGASVLSISDVQAHITKVTVNNLNKNYFTITSTSNSPIDILFHVDLPLRYRTAYSDFTIVEGSTVYDAYHYATGFTSPSMLQGQSACETSPGFGVQAALKIGTVKFTPATSCRTPLDVPCDSVCPSREDVPLIKTSTDYCGNGIDIDIHCDKTTKPTQEKFDNNRFVLYYSKITDVVPVIKGYIHDTNTLPDKFPYAISLHGSVDSLRDYVCNNIKFATVKNYATMYSDPDNSIEFNWPYNDLYWFTNTCPPSIPGDPADPNTPDPNDPEDDGQPIDGNPGGGGDPDPNPPNDPSNPLPPKVDTPVALVPC